MKKRKYKTIVVLPAYNASNTLIKTFNDIPKEYVDEIILVDDFSKDNTIDIAKQLGIKHYQHSKNLGYGGNQKTCYNKALELGGEIIIMLHPDYQYDPKLIKYFIEFIENNYFDVMLGSRIRTRKEAINHGMPFYKYFSNRLLSLFQNIITGQNLSEWHTGMRAYKSEVLEKINFGNFSNDFVFDSQMLFEICKLGYKIGDIPVPVRYNIDSSSINFTSSLKYGLQTIRLTINFLFWNIFNEKK